MDTTMIRYAYHRTYRTAIATSAEHCDSHIIIWVAFSAHDAWETLPNRVSHVSNVALDSKTTIAESQLTCVYHHHLCCLGCSKHPSRHRFNWPIKPLYHHRTSSKHIPNLLLPYTGISGTENKLPTFLMPAFTYLLAVLAFPKLLSPYCMGGLLAERYEQRKA
ncbi:hypothetical protein J1614_007004 [Plenodomus biglobosus]|nr:hypothetical protein J1614_007004 [Plenodomus biglobosus]